MSLGLNTRVNDKLFGPALSLGRTYLHEATHDAVAEEQLIPAESHGRDDGVEWPFSTLQ